MLYKGKPKVAKKSNFIIITEYFVIVLFIILIELMNYYSNLFLAYLNAKVRPKLHSIVYYLEVTFRKYGLFQDMVVI